MTVDRLLRTSERNMFNRCRWQHGYAYAQRLKPNMESAPLRFGTLIHRALEDYYMTPVERRRRKLPREAAAPSDTFLKMYDAEVARTQREIRGWNEDDRQWEELRDVGMFMLNEYVKRYAGDPTEWVTLATEQTFRYPIVTPTGADPLPSMSPTVYVGTFDRVLYNRRSHTLWLGDYKTTKSDPTKVSHLVLDEQAGAYWAFAPPWLVESAPAALQAQIRRQLRHLPPSVRDRVVDDDGQLKFAGILYDFMRKPTLGTIERDYGTGPKRRKQDENGHYLNRDGSVSKQQPLPLFHREHVYRDEYDRAHVIERIYHNAVEIGLIRAGEIELTKSPDMFHCRMCAYNDMCELHETGGDWIAYRDATTHKWDPYNAHAIENEAHGDSDEA
jgi:hypothetical protein